MNKQHRHEAMEDAAVFRHMAAEYRVLCEARPGMNRATIALIVGCRVYDVDVEDIQRRSAGYSLSQVRHKLMAFSRVISLTQQRKLSFPMIGKAFHRDHTTAMYAFQKYGEQIGNALQ